MHYRTLFVSDIHLGTKQSKVNYLLDFLRDNTFDNVYLCGDIIDIYALSHKWYWHIEHNTFIQKVLRLSRKGTKVIYIPGNHDDIVREWVKEVTPFMFGDIEIKESDDYISKSGKTFKIIHGDEFDGAFRSLGWLYWIGDRAYEFALSLNNLLNWFRKKMGFKYWSLSSYLKGKVKGAIQAVNNFEELVVRQCLTDCKDGIIYGHTHCPSMKTIKTKEIFNIGDHVESCTCLIETSDGEFQLINTTNNTILDRKHI